MEHRAQTAIAVDRREGELAKGKEGSLRATAAAEKVTGSEGRLVTGGETGKLRARRGKRKGSKGKGRSRCRTQNGRLASKTSISRMVRGTRSGLERKRGGGRWWEVVERQWKGSVAVGRTG